MSKIAVKRPVTTLMVILIAVSLGIMSVFNLQMDSMPNMNMPIVLVMTNYSGAGPEEVLELVTKPIESALSTMTGLDSVTSQSSAGSSMVMLEFEDSVDVDDAKQEINDTLNQIKNRLPDDANDPTVLKMEMNSSSIMTISVTSDTLSQVDLRSTVDDKLVEVLDRVDGVASVDVSGGLEKEIVVEIISDKANGYGISMSDINQLLISENQDYAGGNVQEGTKEINLKTKGSLKGVDDIKNLTITTKAGNTILLSDVANIYEGYKDVTTYSYVNGQPNISIQISKQSTGNTVSVSNAVQKVVAQLQAENEDLHINITSDSADDIRTSINSVIEAAWQGMLLAVAILFLFLKNIRSTIVVALAMPISIASTFTLMYYGGLTLNTMSLSGLVLGVGMLVDNSIVVLESIFRRMEEGEPRVQAAINGAKEVAMSIVASTLTTVAVFLPITFMGGMVAQYFNDIAFTIAFALFASLVVALTFVPVACSLILAPEKKSKVAVFRKTSETIENGLRNIEKGYKKLLGIALGKKALTVTVSVVFFFASLYSVTRVGMEFMTFGTAGEINLSLTMPDGTVIDETVKVADEAQERLEDFADVIDTMTLRIGSTSAQFQISLTDSSTREKDNDTITREIRQAMSTMAGVEVSTEARMFGGGSGGDLTLQVKGSDVDTLAEIGDDIVALLKSVDGIVEPSSSVNSANQEAVVVVNRAKAANYGLSATTIANEIYTAINGSTPTSIKIDGDEISVNVKYSDEKTTYLTDISNLMITTTSGVNVPLSELAEITKQNAAQTIGRLDQETYIEVTATLDGIDTGSASTLVSQALSGYIMPSGYSWSFGGTQMNMTEAFSGLGKALIMALFLVYAIMAAEFESLYYPFIIMFSIPIALSSGLLGLWVTGTSLSITAYLGLIMLAGIIINNAIVLVDYINILRRERDKDLIDAVITAGPVRLRAILMSTFTTVLGLVPMMLGLSEGAETMQPLAIVIVFGLTISTLVTLVLVPVLYVGFENIAVKIRKVLGIGQPASLEQQPVTE